MQGVEWSELQSRPSMHGMCRHVCAVPFTDWMSLGSSQDLKNLPFNSFVGSHQRSRNKDTREGQWSRLMDSFIELSPNTALGSRQICVIAYTRSSSSVQMTPINPQSAPPSSPSSCGGFAHCLRGFLKYPMRCFLPAAAHSRSFLQCAFWHLFRCGKAPWRHVVGNLNLHVLQCILTLLLTLEPLSSVATLDLLLPIVVREASETSNVTASV
jgi:hypothetical protein